jgi:hypothetical protein
MQHARLAKLRARSLERVANSEKDAAAHEKGGFACGCVSIDEMGDVDWVGGCEWRGKVRWEGWKAKWKGKETYRLPDSVV